MESNRGCDGILQGPPADGHSREGSQERRLARARLRLVRANGEAGSLIAQLCRVQRGACELETEANAVNEEGTASEGAVRTDGQRIAGRTQDGPVVEPPLCSG